MLKNIYQRKHYKIKFKLQVSNKFLIIIPAHIQMHNLRNNLFENEHLNYQQNTRNKATVKKQLPHRALRFNQTYGKQNQYNHSNLIMNLASKETVRKNTEISQQKNEVEIQHCANHPSRNAEFMVRIDDETLNYCKKCATHIASQGFDVHKIVTSPIHNLTRQLRSSQESILSLSSQILLPNISPSRRGPSSSSHSSRIQNEKLSQLLQLTNSLKQLKSQYTQKSQYLAQICSTFESQKQTLTHYYAQLISYIQQIRDSHIQAIDESSINAVQVCQIQKGQIQETVEEIEQMVQDIENNMQKILNEVDQQSYIECYEFYKQKEGIFSHRLQELGTEAKPWPCTSEQQINHKIRSFKSVINQLHQVHDDQGQEDPQNQAQSFVY